MYEAEEALLQAKGIGFYKTLLFFYPKPYRKRFGEQMLLTFEDLYQEELEKSGQVGASFWLSIFTDTLQSASREHFNLMKQKGILNYLHLNIYNVIGAILLFPFAFFFTAGMIARIAQGDLEHYNRAWYATISHWFFYGGFKNQAQAEFTILILLPILAILINLIPLIKTVLKSKRVVPLKLILANPITILILLGGLFALAVVYGHDVIPCTLNSLKAGHGVIETINYCKNA
jgi:hypothetical protein